FLQRRMPFAGMIRRLMRAAARASLRYADALRAVSSNTRRQLLDHAPAGLPMHQFLTWTDAEAFNAPTRALLPSQTHDLIYVGVLIPRKGVHYLLKAFTPLAEVYLDAHLWIVGSADNPVYAESLKQQVAESGLNDRVTFTGKMAQAELAQLFGRCRALVLPSSSEGLPRVIIEAMLMALPVVATRVSGIPDVIQEGVNGYLVPPDDVPALANALRAVLENPDVDRMGQNGQDFARQFFSADVYAAGYAALLADAQAVLNKRVES
ncbi:MAG: glycosyltransferase family 4 protein, partial [Anaerolineae bacterium]|nr:glycosyltransferase family 4 protein [Anaerolineae bacterium]